MNKKVLVSILFGSILAFPLLTWARVDIGISISLPPPLEFVSPPELIVIPETQVYALPDLEVEIFFYRGWWWRLWEGRWYRSRHYGSGWSHYHKAPSFYRALPRDWRDEYREHRWRGRPWEQQRIPHEQLQRDWRDWERNRHWERHNSWGVQGLAPKSSSRPQAREVYPYARESASARPGRPQPRRVEEPSGWVEQPQPRPGRAEKRREMQPAGRESAPQPQRRPQFRGGDQPPGNQPRRGGPPQAQPRPGRHERGAGEPPERE